VKYDYNYIVRNYTAHHGVSTDNNIYTTYSGE
jgi:hypothetical protein